MKIESLNNEGNETFGKFFNSVNELHSVLKQLDESFLTVDLHFDRLLEEMKCEINFINEIFNKFKT